MQQWRPESRSMTFDEVSMERSKSFVKALQELKNLRPQLYSAAEYCEKSYLQSEQKQMVLDNLKSYAVRALVNAVDHLGTVAYKLTEPFEQQKLDILMVESKISCLNQQCCTCQAYGNKQGLSQLNMTARTLRHHKHYILPDFLSKYEQSSSQVPSNGNTNPFQAKSHSHASGKSASKTLSWHLAIEANSGPSRASTRPPSCSTRDAKSSKVNPEVFHLLVADKPAASLPPSSHQRETGGNKTSDTMSNKFALMGPVEAFSKPVSGFKSLDSPAKLEIYRPPARTKNMFSSFFTKGKNFKQRNVSVS